MTALTPTGGTDPLAGKTALVTGVSRRKGIGYGIARQLAELGAHVAIQHYAPHDERRPWGGDDLGQVCAGIQDAQRDGATFSDHGADLSDPDTHGRLLDAASELTGTVDILVCNHAKSGDDGSIFDMTPQRLDAFWQVNTRSTILLTRLFAERYRPGDTSDIPGTPGTRDIPDAPDTPGASEAPARPGDRSRPTGGLDEHRTGRVIWLTSGQQDGPMRGEVAYVASKAALAGITTTVAAELLERGIVLNTVNPGPVNTGYLDPETTDRDLADITAMIESTPFGRFGAPGDPARLIGWLVTDAGRWVVGQVLKSDGGFDLWR